MFFENGFYYFGGNSGDSFGTLEKISFLHSKTFLWSTVGALLEKRQKHNVIEVQGQFLILGGEIKKDGLLGTVITFECQEKSRVIWIRRDLFPIFTTIHPNFAFIVRWICTSASKHVY